jgi:hypothetical protein
MTETKLKPPTECHLSDDGEYIYFSWDYDYSIILNRDGVSASAGEYGKDGVVGMEASISDLITWLTAHRKEEAP